MVQKFAHMRKKQYLCTVKFDTAKVVLNFDMTKFLMKKIKFFDIFYENDPNFDRNHFHCNRIDHHPDGMLPMACSRMPSFITHRSDHVLFDIDCGYVVFC